MVVQISVDIAVTEEEYNRYNSYQFENEVADALERQDFTVLGSAWKTTWTDDDYEHGRQPISSD